MVQHGKEGYEATPLLEDAAVAAQQAPLQAAPRKWHGHLLNCFGDCDALGWSTCLVTHYCPAVTFGLTTRRAFGMRFLRAFLIIFSLTLLTWAQYATQASLVGNDCLAEPLPPPRDTLFIGRRFGPSGTVTLVDVRARAAKPFGQLVDAHKVDSELCGSLVQTSTALNVMVILYTLAITFYGARMRTAMRERFGIEGSSFKDFLAWWWCMPCAMCQEARTMGANSVENGVWQNSAAGLPMCSAAAETRAPSVPVMTVETVKPLNT